MPLRKPRFRKTHPTAVSGHHLRDVLGRVSTEIHRMHELGPEAILAAWPALVGPKLAPMCKAVGFIDGILTVKVSNSTLLSLLSQYERVRLLQALRRGFPQINIKTILFRIN